MRKDDPIDQEQSSSSASSKGSAQSPKWVRRLDLNRKPLSVDVKSRLDTEAREQMSKLYKVRKAVRKFQAYRVNKIEENLAILPASLGYFLAQGYRHTPLTVASVTEFLHKTEKLKKGQDQFTYLIIDGLQAKMRKKISQVKDAKFEEGLAAFANAVYNTDFYLFHSSPHEMKDDAILSQMDLEIEGRYHSGAGLISDGRKSEKRYGFAYLTASKSTQSILREDKEARNFFFNAHKSAQAVDFFVRDNDVVAYQKPITLLSHMFGRVLYTISIQERQGKMYQVVTTVGPGNIRKEYWKKQNTEIATEKTYKEIMSLDAVEVVRQVYAVDPKSGWELMGGNYETKEIDPNKQAQNVKEILGLFRKEVSFVRELPFKVPTKTEKKSESEDQLLIEVQEVKLAEIQKLFEAINSSNVDQVRDLLSKQDKKDEKQSLPGNPNVPLLRNLNLINSRLCGLYDYDEKKPITPLIYAIRLGEKEMVRLLLECGADVNAREGYVDLNVGYAYGFDALMTAAEIGDFETVQLLVEKYGANIGALKSSEIDYSKNDNALSLVMKLLNLAKKGSNLKSVEKYTRIAEYLISKGARNLDGSTITAIDQYKDTETLAIQFRAGKKDAEPQGIAILGQGRKTDTDEMVDLKGNVVVKPRFINTKSDLEWVPCHEKTYEADIVPSGLDDIQSFSQNILQNKLTKDSMGAGTKTVDYSFDDDAKACFVFRDESGAYQYVYGDEAKKVFQEFADYGFDYTTAEYSTVAPTRIPVFFYSPQHDIIKIISRTTLGEVLEQLSELGVQKPLCFTDYVHHGEFPEVVEHDGEEEQSHLPLRSPEVEEVEAEESKQKPQIEHHEEAPVTANPVTSLGHSTAGGVSMLPQIKGQPSCLAGAGLFKVKHSGKSVNPVASTGADLEIGAESKAKSSTSAGVDLETSPEPTESPTSRGLALEVGSGLEPDSPTSPAGDDDSPRMQSSSLVTSGMFKLRDDDEDSIASQGYSAEQDDIQYVS